MTSRSRKYFKQGAKNRLCFVFINVAKAVKLASELMSIALKYSLPPLPKYPRGSIEILQEYGEVMRTIPPGKEIITHADALNVIEKRLNLNKNIAGERGQELIQAHDKHPIPHVFTLRLGKPITDMSNIAQLIRNN